MHSSEASGAKFEAVFGPAQFQVRMPEAILHVTQGGLRIEVYCRPGGPGADGGLHFGLPGV
eukprot:4605432-Alexandrium_andersonii.AAC.1